MIQMIIVMAVIIVLPIALFLSIVGLAIFIWCWNRIGRYFINFGRWLGSWRNFIPLSVLGIVNLILILVILPIMGLPRTAIVVLLIPFLLVTFIIFLFAWVAWIVALVRWFWPWWRKIVWSGVLWIWDMMPGQRRRPAAARPSAEVKGPRRRKAAVTGQPRKASWLATLWALMLGKPVKPTHVEPIPGSGQEPGTQPRKRSAPVKRSMLASFWAIMMGKPTTAARPRPEPTRVQTTEQTLGPSGSAAATARTESAIPETAPSRAPTAEKKRPPKRSWFGAFWSLLMGKPTKSGKPKPGIAKVKTAEQAPGLPQTGAAATAKAGATARVTDAATPERAKREKPAKRGFLAGIWTSIVRGVTFVVGLVFLAVVWVVQKTREGIEWIRIRLNLD